MYSKQEKWAKWVIIRTSLEQIKFGLKEKYLLLNSCWIKTVMNVMNSSTETMLKNTTNSNDFGTEFVNQIFFQSNIIQCYTKNVYLKRNIEFQQIICTYFYSSISMIFKLEKSEKYLRIYWDTVNTRKMYFDQFHSNEIWTLKNCKLCHLKTALSIPKIRCLNLTGLKRRLYT